MITDQTTLPHTSFYQCNCRSIKVKVCRNLHYLKVQNFWLWIAQLWEQETAVIRVEKRSCHKQCPIVKSWMYIPTCCPVSFDCSQNAVAVFHAGFVIPCTPFLFTLQAEKLPFPHSIPYSPEDLHFTLTSRARCSFYLSNLSLDVSWLPHLLLPSSSKVPLLWHGANPSKHVIYLKTRVKVNKQSTLSNVKDPNLWSTKGANTKFSWRALVLATH